MKTTIITMLLVLALTVSGCLNQITSSETNGSKEPTEQIFCTEDARLCPDGSSVGRNPDNNCDFFDCPLETKVDVKFRDYAANSVEQCAATTFICNVEGTKAFFDQSGCGCEAVEPKKYVSEDLEQCMLIKYMCTENRVPFTDEVGCGCEFSWEEANKKFITRYSSKDVQACASASPQTCNHNGEAFIDDVGCGCKWDEAQITDDRLVEYSSKNPKDCANIGFWECADGGWAFTDEGCGCEWSLKNTGKLQAIDCPEKRTQACTKEYMPVCGQVQVECITAPCDPVKQTFGNKCEACANSRTISYFEGTCEDENKIPEEKPTEGKLQAIDCPETRTQACTKEYMPVCGQVNVECGVGMECPPIKQTFSNKCEACAERMTISYFQGACEDENLAGGTVLAGTNEEQCTSIGGTWTGYDCTGIGQNQCQEIGGTFNECASACRNDPNAEICTMQCVQVCTFD